ncbi:hypothetical protein EPD60_00780 [Flaviaesturariibacter flavus]|uniref:Periplasmic heavy metal sensor n=1 Tax=Flaviaesturariibacter flavus TaxID=2502780 RepID=A0A4R1BN36_9BACT|nr:hypothetical protein [Flaviaesturariibacter flavus]TCJ18980.1 hypothetical protein EPD60_00780 [Flaviaesturariibacter flavus]
MKKLFFLLALTAGISSTSLYAQDQQRDPAAMAQRYKERVKPALVEKLKFSDTEAEKIMDIYLGQREQMRGLRDLSQEDRAKKMEEMNADLAKKLKAIPLSDEQVKTVTTFFEEQRAQQRQRMQQNGGGGR